MKKSMALFTLVAVPFFANSAVAANLDIKVQNLTQNIHFTPLLVAAHSNNNHVFEVGMAASSSLQKMAEGGDITALQQDLTAINANMVANPAAGLLAPGKSTMTSLTTTDANNTLSLVGMILPTNDGFVGLDGWKIPTQAGTYSMYLNAYDAGTEANNELVVGSAAGAPGVLGIPGDPTKKSGTNGTGVTNTEAVQVVHIHRGTLGDDNLTGGKSDLTNTVHRWLNPVAKVTITVK